MAPHPLTPRKPVLPATLAGTAAFVATTLAGLCLLIQLQPPAGWLHSADASMLIDLRFLTDGFADMVDEAVFRRSMLTAAVNLVELPGKYLAALHTLDIEAPLAIRGMAAIVAGLLIGLRVHSRVAAATVSRRDVLHVRGPLLVAGDAARRALAVAWRKRFGTAAAGIPLTDGVIMPRQAETEHMLVVGGTGAGKTTILQTIMDGAIRRGDRVLALDVKGDVTACLPTDDFALFSLDDARSVRWRVGRDVRDREDAAELAIVLIPDTSDPSWSAGARRVLTGLIVHLQRRATEARRNWSRVDLDRLLQKSVEELHALLVVEDPGAAALIDVTRDETRKQACSFYLVLVANAARAVSSSAQMGKKSGRAISVRDWLAGRDKAQVLILRQSQRRPELSAALVRLALKCAADAAADRATAEAPSPVWIVLDELPQIGLTPAPLRLAAIGRSAGIRLIAAIQSPAQLRDIHGEDATQHLLDNTITKIVGRVAPGKTAEEIAAKWIGNRTVSWWEEMSRGADGGPRTERRMQDIPVVDANALSEELGLARDWRGRPVVRALVVGHGDVARLEWPVGRWPVRRPAMVRVE